MIGHAPRLEALAARTAGAAPVRSRLAAARRDGGPCADDDAGTGRNRLCRRFGPPWNLRPLCHDRPAARVRAVRSQPHPGAGARFVSRPRDSCRRAAALGRRCDARRGPCRHDGRGVGSGVHPDRARAPGIRHRAPVQADPLRLHERHCVHGPDQPAADAFRLFDRRRRTSARAPANRPIGARWSGELDRVRRGRRHARGNSALQAFRASPWHPDRGRGRHAHGRCARA